MRDNDIIAEYVRTRLPDILKTTDFALYRLGVALNDAADSFLNGFKSIDFEAVFEKEKQKSKSIDEWESNTMKRFEKVE